MIFRLLKAEEIDCRIGTVKKDDSGFSLLLYKDARVDQNILDETVGPMDWQKHYSRDNANCVVSIWDDNKKQWIEKEDTGTESNTEAEKGLASDSFKRACFAWGIGRELYTAPFIWINGKCDKYAKYYVSKIAYDDARNISQLAIVDAKGNQVFSYGLGTSNKAAAEPRKATEPKVMTITPEEKANILHELNRTHYTVDDVLATVKNGFGLTLKSLDDIPRDAFPKLYKSLLSWPVKE